MRPKGRKSEMHGHSRTRTYRRWITMKSRCMDPKHPAFERYSLLGIHGPWVESFQEFLDHLGECPSDDHTLDRIDTSAGYFPGNVRWATSREQGRNRKDSLKVAIGGRDRLVVELAEEYGLNYTTIRERARSGWTGYDLVAPAGHRRGRKKTCWS